MGGKVTKAERNVGVVLPADGRRPRERQRHTKTTAKRSNNTPSYSQNSRAPRPWTPTAPSPDSTDYTVSTDKSSGRHSTAPPHSHIHNHHPHRLSSSSSGSELAELPLRTTYSGTMAERSNTNTYPQQQQHRQQRAPVKDRRVLEAEKILEEIAKEYAAKRAAGLVPTKPVPARTLLWEELANKSTQAGRRGECIFGRDTDAICGCTNYKKTRMAPGQTNSGICVCCGHGAAWHRLTGGTTARSSRMSRSIFASSARGSHLDTGTGSYVPSEARSSMYDYDSDDDEDDSDDEAIANEMAVPSSFYPVANAMPPPPGMFSNSNLDRVSLLSMGSGGFPSRLSSGANSLGVLLQAIQRYRDMGLDEDEIEARIRGDFPPVPRKSSVATRSDISQTPSSQVDI